MVTNLSDISDQFTILLKQYDQKILYHAVKCLFVGPPRVGKTSTKLHLLGDIENLTKQQELDSTGLEAPTEMTYIDNETAALIDVEDIDTDSASTCIWSKLGLAEMASLLMYNIESQKFKEDTSTISSTNTDSALHVLTQASDKPTGYGEPSAASHDAYTDINTSSEHALHKLDEMSQQAELKQQVIEHLNKSTTMYLIDTGGQPEFHDILPLMLQGPAFYFIFFSLAESLDDLYTVKCNINGKHIESKYQSGLCVKEVIGQLLNTFAYFSKQKEEMCSVESRAFIFATNLDNPHMDINEIDTKLRQALEFKSGSPQYNLVEYNLVDAGAIGKSNTIFIPISNNFKDPKYKLDSRAVEKIRHFITDKVKKYCEPVEIPIPWLSFHLLLRQEYSKDKVCAYADSVKLAQRCHIDKDDVKLVLTYLYRKLGTILFLKDVEGLDDLVICNPEIIYKCISDLIFAFYTTFEEDDIRVTGLIPAQEFKKQIETHHHKLLTPNYIIKLLEHFRITSGIQIDNINPHQHICNYYLMPCLLSSLTSKQLDTQPIDIDSDPLLVCFPFIEEAATRQECRVIPNGLATALVVKLHSTSSKKFVGVSIPQPWKYLNVRQYKNKYRFKVYCRYDVVLVVKGKYVELNLIKDPGTKPVRSQLRKDLIEALRELCEQFQYNITPKPYFYCCNRKWLHLAKLHVDGDQFECCDANCDVGQDDLSSTQKEWLKVSFRYLIFSFNYTL